jgi:hypothetical protein
MLHVAPGCQPATTSCGCRGAPFCTYRIASSSLINSPIVTQPELSCLSCHVIRQSVRQLHSLHILAAAIHRHDLSRARLRAELFLHHMVAQVVHWVGALRWGQVLAALQVHKALLKLPHIRLRPRALHPLRGVSALVQPLRVANLARLQPPGHIVLLLCSSAFLSSASAPAPSCRRRRRRRRRRCSWTHRPDVYAPACILISVTQSGSNHAAMQPWHWCPPIGR